VKGERERLQSGAPTRAELLALRSRCLGALRAFFHEQGYIEVETPRLVRNPGLEPHLRPLPAADGYLITSPEYQMKRLLAGGLEKIYSMGPCWRDEEWGSHHLREFTMLEWYRVGATLEELMDETEALVARAALEVGGDTAVHRAGAGPLDLTPPFERLTVADACRQHGGVDLAGVVEAPELRRRLLAAGLDLTPEETAFDALFSRLLVERVEPALATLRRPVLLYDYPAPLAALSRLHPDDSTVARRFELYAAGLELANAFWELTDATEQRRRLEQDLADRRAVGLEAYALDERFLAALEQGMPEAAGIALGVDRLVMLLTGEQDIRRVAAFGPDEL